MAKYCGVVGYASTIESPANSGIWVESIVERKYRGDVIIRKSRWEVGSSLNDNINVTNEISIVADPYAYRHFSEIRYAEYMGAMWKVTSVTEARPRLTLTLGGVWNGEQA